LAGGATKLREAVLRNGTLRGQTALDQAQVGDREVQIIYQR